MGRERAFVSNIFTGCKGDVLNVRGFPDSSIGIGIGIGTYGDSEWCDPDFDPEKAETVRIGSYVDGMG